MNFSTQRNIDMIYIIRYDLYNVSRILYKTNFIGIKFRWLIFWWGITNLMFFTDEVTFYKNEYGGDSIFNFFMTCKIAILVFVWNNLQPKLHIWENFAI